jgi:hypothetical protein
MKNKNSSFKKLTYKNNISKSKERGLLLTDINKFGLIQSKAKTTKKRKNINHKKYENEIDFKLINNTNSTKGLKKELLNNIDILDNNIPKQTNESMKCNSVNNLIGININVNYMDKNYSIKKLKNNFDNSYNIYNNKSKLNHKNNNSYNEINCLNNQNSSSSKNKTKFNKKNIYILNQINQDWEKIIDIIKTKKRNQTKININDKIKSEKNIRNYIGNKTNNSTDDNNIINFEKSSSCKNLHFIPNNQLNNKFKSMYQIMSKKIEQIKLKQNNYESPNKIIKIINEYFLKYSNEIENKNQKQMILYIFNSMKEIIKIKDKTIISLKKENEEMINLNKILKAKNEELIKNNKILEPKIKILSQNDIKASNKNNEEISIEDSESSSVNTEELESIRFFDKIIMKKNTFINIPELSFKKINKNKNEKNIIMPLRKNIKKRFSYQGNKNNCKKEIKKKSSNLKEKEIKKNSRNKNNDRNTQLYYMRKINEEKEKNKPDIKSFINIFEKSRNKK